MSQADFTYECASDGAGLPASVSIFADRPYLRDQIAEDLRGAGFRAGHCGGVAALVRGEVTALGDVVLLDCPQVDAEATAALCRLDMRVARSGARLIVSTSMMALDTVFSCFDQSAPQILVDASRAERIVAVGRILGDVSRGRVREMAEEDRLVLMRLSQQVDAIARQLDGFGAEPGSEVSSLSDRRRDYRGREDEAPLSQNRSSARPPLPDPGEVRRMIRERQARAQFFDAELFADPAWDMLLDLTAAHGEHQRVSVSSLCIASGVPATTALRWIRQMVDNGLFDRVEDAQDRRRAFISLSEDAVHAMAGYFAAIRKDQVKAAA